MSFFSSLLSDAVSGLKESVKSIENSIDNAMGLAESDEGAALGTTADAESLSGAAVTAPVPSSSTASAPSRSASASERGVGGGSGGGESSVWNDGEWQSTALPPRRATAKPASTSAPVPLRVPAETAAHMYTTKVSPKVDPPPAAHASSSSKSAVKPIAKASAAAAAPAKSTASSKVMTPPAPAPVPPAPAPSVPETIAPASTSPPVVVAEGWTDLTLDDVDLASAPAASESQSTPRPQTAVGLVEEGDGRDRAGGKVSSTAASAAQSHAASSVPAQTPPHVAHSQLKRKAPVETSQEFIVPATLTTLVSSASSLGDDTTPVAPPALAAPVAANSASASSAPQDLVAALCAARVVAAENAARIISLEGLLSARESKLASLSEATAVALNEGADAGAAAAAEIAAVREAAEAQIAESSAIASEAIERAVAAERSLTEERARARASAAAAASVTTLERELADAERRAKETLEEGEILSRKLAASEQATKDARARARTAEADRDARKEELETAEEEITTLKARIDSLESSVVRPFHALPAFTRHGD